MHPTRSFATLAVVLMLTSGLPLGEVGAQAVAGGCTVPSGTPIQLALDRARPGDVVTVCPGIYAESLVVRVDGLTLAARGSVALDGTALVGPRHGIALGPGVEGFTLTGFEVRGYDDPLVGDADPSSGLVSFHGATRVRITRGHFHDNAWAGVFAVGPGNAGWVVENGTFEDNGFADLHLHGARDVQVRNGSFDSGLVLSEVAGVRVVDNSFRGGGRGAIAVTPGVQSDDASRQVVIQRNSITGNYRHGVWMLGVDHGIVTDNAIDVRGVGLTVGGDSAAVTLARNGGSFAYETHATEVVKSAFKKGRPAHAQAHVQDAGVTVLGCAGLLCGVSALLDRLLPSASAQATPSPEALCVGNPACNVVNISALVSYALAQGLNPGADAGAVADHARLQSCAGKPDACLRTAFFVDDGLTPLDWTAPVPATTGVPAGTLVFVDAGLRKPGETLARHAARGSLNDTWTTLVLCRFVVGGVARPCDAAPLSFDFGLDLDWSDASGAEHLSRWRLKLPDGMPHDSFDRVHALDATLFRLDVKPRDASSPPPPDSPFPVASVPADPLRVQPAGRAILVCDVVAAADGVAGAPPTRNGCPARAMLAEQLQTGLLWCRDPRPEMAPTRHDTLLMEASAGWRWSRTCSPANPAGSATDWATLFGPADLGALADAQNASYAATTQAQRDAADAAVQALLARLVARHLALDVPGQGMPLSTDAALLDRTLPGFAPRNIDWSSRAYNDAFWTGQHALVFGGSAYDRSEITAYHPDRWVDQPQARLPEHQGSVTAVWTGREAYVFATASYDESYRPRGEIYRYDPATDSVLTLSTLLPYDFQAATSVWDPRDLPHLGCPGGCAYVFEAMPAMEEGATTSPPSPILRYNPLLGQLAPTGTTLTWPHGLAACFDGRHAYLFGGIGDDRAILRFDPLDDSLRVMDAVLPSPRENGECAWDGRLMYVIGGSGTDPAIYTYDPATDRAGVFPSGLVEPVIGPAVFWTGTEAIAIHGFTAIPKWRDLIATQRIPLGFDPATRVPALLAATSDYRAVPIAAGGTGIQQLRVRDGDSWAPVTAPGLVAFTPMRLDVSFSHVGANGDLVQGNHSVVVRDRAPDVAAASVVHAGKVLVDVQAADPDNLDHASGFRPDGARRTHTLPIVNASGGVGVLGHTVELPLDARSLGACARQAWTARSDGIASNLDGLGRLAFQDNASVLAGCRVLDLAPELLRYHAPVVVSLEIRQGSAYGATLSVADDPLRHAARKDDPGARPTLAQAAAAYAPTPAEAAVQPVSGRIVLTLPSDLLPAARSDALAALLAAYSGDVGVFAVEMDDLPLTPALARAVEEAAAERGATVLVGSGSLPVAARGLPRQEKLMTITGLAASPHVVTVGALGPEGGVAAWSRRGPTPSLLPKPDFVAPSPEGTTAGAVANLLPFVEALGARGLRDPALVRAVLAAYAFPVHGDDGAHATYWDQGLGAVDLSRHLSLPATSGLLEELRVRRGDADAAATAAHLAQALGTTSAAVTASPPGALLGVAAHPTPLLRAAVGATLLNLTLDMPALPAQAVVDFGVVNHERVGAADFTPLDYAAVVAAASNATRLLLENAGYTGTQLDQTAAQVEQLVQLRIAQGNDVTLDATHYYLFDLLTRGDFLHTTYRSLLDAERLAQPTPPPGVDEANATRLRDQLTTWAFGAAHTYHLVDAKSGHARTAVTAQGDPHVAVQGSLQLGSVAMRVLQTEAWLLNGTPLQPQALALDAATQATGAALLAALEPDAYQGAPVAPLSAHEALLDFLAGQARALRDLKRAPQGPWSAAEAADGSWNGTTLGRQVGATLATLGHAPGQAAQGGTLVLDALVRTLEDASHALDKDLGPVHAPRLTVGPTTGPTELTTNVSATRAAPLGPYVGLATMTSRNVTTYNPITGEAIDRRDVTIPLPSLLWNNPTLIWHESWRDMAPASSQPVKLVNGEGAIFDHTIVNTTAFEDGVLVYLGADHAAAYQPLVDTLAQVDADLAAEAERDLDATLGAFEDDYKRHLAETRHALNGTRAAAIEASVCEGPDCTVQNWAASLAPGITELFSHRRGHTAVTNATGHIPFRHVFPGSYGLFIPYHFRSVVAQDRYYDYAAPGLGTVNGSLDDPDHAVSRLVRDVLGGLQEHPSSRTPEPPEPEVVPSKRVTGYRVNEVDGSRTPFFHGFGLNVSGVDLLGVACIDAHLFREKTLTDVRLPGCGAPSLPVQQRQEIERIVAVGRCALGEPHPELAADDAEDCAALAAAVRDASLQCAEDPSACGRERALMNLTRRLESYVDRLRDTAAGGASAAIPWVRSPLRLAATRPADFGLTPDGLLPGTRALHGLDPSDASADATLRPAIESALEDLVGLGRDRTVTVVEPKRETQYNHTLATGIMHHVVDRVSGLDWYHLNPRRSVDHTDAGALRDLLLETAAMPLDEDDQTALAGFAAGLAGATDASLLQAFNAALADTLPHVADGRVGGWRANGSVTAKGLRLDRGDATPAPISGPDACAAAGALSPLQVPYFPCETLAAATRPTVNGPAGVDRVQLLGALLERVRARSADLAALDAASAQGRALRLSILTEAVRYAGSGKGETWTRTEDGIQVDADGAPAFGVMLYSIPVPINEVFTARLDAELFMENTAAILVVNANPVVTEAIVKAVAATNVTNLVGSPSVDSLGRMADMSRLIDATINEQGILDPQNEGDPLMRVALLGGGYVLETPQGTSSESSGYRGLLATGPGGAHNLTTAMKFGTRGRGADRFGPDHMDVLLIYFPDVAFPDPATLRQSFAVKNLTIQLETYIGIAASPRVMDFDHRIGYRLNVEDWKSMHAISRMKLAGTTDDPAQEGLDVSVSAIAARGGVLAYHANTRQNILLPVGGRLVTDPVACPVSAAPGFEPSEPFGVTAQPAKDGAITAQDTTPCVRNAARGGGPVHVQGGPRNDTAMSEPRKRFLDALQYTLNVGEYEDFTEAQPGQRCEPESCGIAPGVLERRAGVQEGRPLATAGAEGEAHNAVASARADLYGTELEGIEEDPEGVASRVIDLRGSKPFLEDSVQWHRQATVSEPPFGPRHVLHNWFLLDEKEARTLLPGNHSWDPLVKLRFVDVNDETLTQNTEDNVTNHTHGHVRVVQGRTGHRGGVFAYEVARQPGEGQPATATVSVLAGNGATGAGFALRLTLEDPTLVGDVLAVGPDTLARLDVYRLGGERTPGSDCSEVPLHDYVRRFFRCTGYTEPLTDPAPDAALVAALLDRAQATRPQRQAQTLDEGSDEWWALRRLDTPEPTRVDMDVRAALAAARAGEAVSAGVLTQAALLIQARDAAGTPLFPANSLAQMAQSLRAGLNASLVKGTLAQVTPHLRDVTARVQPGLAANGEPPRLLVPALGLLEDGAATAPQPASPGSMRLVGALTAAYAVDEWSTRLREGTLVETLTPANGAPQTRTLATLTPASRSGVVTPWRPSEGDAHALRLTVVDEYGNVFVDEAAYVVDNTAPLIGPSPANPLHSGPDQPTVDLSFRIDETRGLRRVHLETYAGAGAWVPLGVELGAEDLANGTSWLNATLDVSGVVVHGAAYGVRVVAIDHAGNQAQAEHHVVRDLAPPDVSGLFLSASRGYQAKPAGRAAYGAWDNMTGLASWSAWLVDTTNGSTIPLTSHTALAGGSAAGEGNWTATLGHVYRLHVRAKDAGGNERTADLGIVNVLTAPALTPIMPRYLLQQTGYQMHFVADVEFPEFPDENADGFSLRVDAAPYAKGRPPVFRTTGTHAGGPIHVWWNATETEAPPGTYTVGFAAWKGNHYRNVWLDVQLTPLLAGHYALEGSADNAYGSLATLGDSTLYRFTHPNCADEDLEVDLLGLDGAYGALAPDVDLYVGQGALGHDPAAYAHKHENASHEHRAIVPASANGVYSILVKQKGVDAADADYELRVRACLPPGTSPEAYAAFNAPPRNEVSVEAAA